MRLNLGQKKKILLKRSNYAIRKLNKPNKCSAFESNALHLESREGHKEIDEIFIEKEINIDPTDEERKNPFHFAVEKGHKEIVLFLIKIVP